MILRLPVVEGEVDVNSKNDGDQPYDESGPHSVLAFDERRDDAAHFEVDVNENPNQHKPQNVMDEELRVQKGNWRYVFNVSEQRGQHHCEYCNNLNDDGSSHNSAVSRYPSPARKINGTEHERDEHELNNKICRRQRSNINRHGAPLYSYPSPMKVLRFLRRANRKHGTSPARRAAQTSIHTNATKTK